MSTDEINYDELDVEACRYILKNRDAQIKLLQRQRDLQATAIRRLTEIVSRRVTENADLRIELANLRAQVLTKGQQ